MEKELRSLAAVELRFDSGLIHGVVMPYGRPGRHPDGRTERFEQGAFRWWDVALNVGHTSDNVATIGDGSLLLRDTPGALYMEARTDRADEIKAAVEAGSLRGLSVEFRALLDLQVHGERRIVAAVLDGIGIVRNPAYQDATVEVRNARHVWL